jgi:hypothetical protein
VILRRDQHQGQGYSSRAAGTVRPGPKQAKHRFSVNQPGQFSTKARIAFAERGGSKRQRKINVETNLRFPFVVSPPQTGPVGLLSSSIAAISLTTSLVQFDREEKPVVGPPPTRRTTLQVVLLASSSSLLPLGAFFLRLSLPRFCLCRVSL